MELWQTPTPGSAMEKLNLAVRAASEAGDNRALKSYELQLRNVQLEDALRSSRLQEKIANDQMRRAQWEIDQHVQTAAGLTKLQDILSKRGAKVGLEPIDLKGMETEDAMRAGITAYLNLIENEAAARERGAATGEARHMAAWDKWNARKWTAAQSNILPPEALNLLEFAGEGVPVAEVQRRYDAMGLSDQADQMFQALLGEKGRLTGTPLSITPNPVSAYVQIAYPTAVEKEGKGGVGWKTAQEAKIDAAVKTLTEAGDNAPEDWQQGIAALRAEVNRIYGGMVPKFATPDVSARLASYAEEVEKIKTRPGYKPGSEWVRIGRNTFGVRGVPLDPITLGEKYAVDKMVGGGGGEPQPQTAKDWAVLLAAEVDADKQRQIIARIPAGLKKQVKAILRGSPTTTPRPVTQSQNQE